MSSLMQNKKRKKLVVKLITKERKNGANLKSVFDRFAGSVTVASSLGFHSFLTTQSKTVKK